jgi:hypothetical protein
MKTTTAKTPGARIQGVQQFFPRRSIAGITTETFPASGPIAINIELESPEHGNSHNARISRSAHRHTQGAVKG